jgi:DEAD/DEAH box helicase domain-containing protein
MNLGLDEAKAYHAILRREVELLGLVSGSNTLIPVTTEKARKVCSKLEELAKIVAENLGIDIENSRNIVNKLKASGFLINIGYDESKPDPESGNGCAVVDECYRTIHMDIALRSTDMKYYPNGGSMVSSAKLSLHITPMASDHDRCILPGKITKCPDSSTLYTDLSTKLHDAIHEFIGDDTLASALINALGEYLKMRGKDRQRYGFDAYQAAAIAEALTNPDGKAAIIIAPTGAGKTEIFLTITLARLLKGIAKGVREKALIVYPRKFLEVDQASRLLQLVMILNKYLPHGKRIRLGIRDGDSYKIDQYIDDLKGVSGRDKKKYAIAYRGIKCPDGGKLYVAVTPQGQLEVYCCNGDISAERVDEGKLLTKCRAASDVRETLSITREEVRLANIIVTNIWTLDFRLLSCGGRDLSVCELANTSTIVFDEAHEYDPVTLGDLHYIIKTISLLRVNAGLEQPYVIASTATLGNPQDFIRRLAGTEHVVDLTYDTLSKRYKISYNGERAFLTLFVQLLPTTGWNSYISEWAANVLYTWLAMREAGSNAQQAIVFINNVHELLRTVKAIFSHALSLGSPSDMLCIRDKVCASPRERLDVFKHICCLNRKLCSEAEKLIQQNNNIKDLLKDRYSYVYSGTSLEDRSKIYDSFRKGGMGLLFATSSLELGMDYPNVSIILNAGIDKPESIIQRIGRGGRSLENTLNTVLAIILVRNNPIDYRFYADERRLWSIASQSTSFRPKKVASNLLQLRALALLRYATAKELARRCCNSANKSINLKDSLLHILKNIDAELEQHEVEYLGLDNQFVNGLANQLRFLIDNAEKIENLLASIDPQYNNLIMTLNELGKYTSKILEITEDKIEELPNKSRSLLVELINVLSTINDDVEGLRAVIEDFRPSYLLAEIMLSADRESWLKPRKARIDKFLNNFRGYEERILRIRLKCLSSTSEEVRRFCETEIKLDHYDSLLATFVRILKQVTSFFNIDIRNEGQGDTY